PISRGQYRVANMWSWTTGAIIVIANLAILTESRLATIDSGRINGSSIKLDDGTVIDTWFNIPFAKPPLGNLRWRLPQQPDNWTDVRDATKFGNCCPQLSLLIDITNPDFHNFEEDCLNLNVFSPASDGLYPVMVWLHGGAYTASGNVQYNGHFLARKGVVVVSINYRVGILGFLTTEDSAATGNYGMHDQVMALQWVQKNIRKMKGDPNRVTIFGQSAGASSSGLMILSKKARGLFHQAICQSGSDMAPWAINYPEMGPAYYTKELVKRINENRGEDDPIIPTNNNTEMVEALRKVDIWDMMLVDDVPRKKGWISLGFVPVVDGLYGIPEKDAFLHDTPPNLREKNEFAKVNIMSGLTTEDGSLYVPAVIPDIWDFPDGYSRTEFLERLKNMSYEFSDPSISEVIYQAMSFEYSTYPHVDDAKGNRDRLVELFTDVGFTHGIDLQLLNHNQFNSTYEYVIGMVTSNVTGAEGIDDLHWIGNPHSGDLPYVWGWPMLQDNQAVMDQTGQSSLLAGVVGWNEQDKNVSDFVMTLWTNFAKHGNPTPTPVNNVTWKQFTPAERNFLYIDRPGEHEPRKDYRVHQLAFWQRFVPWILNQTSDATTPASPPTPTTTTVKSSSESLGLRNNELRFCWMLLSLVLLVFV
ncbi:unnamed protein product, partial [Owenia fusiformis]